jgi:nucleotidyltransferase/DNA polymerase involved in DNA repair
LRLRFYRQARSNKSNAPKKQNAFFRYYINGGFTPLGQLAALSRDDLAARLGASAVELWERANGRAERILKLVSPPESFIESFEFENEIETIEPLLFILRRFLQQLATRLNTIYLVAKELRLRITFADKSQYERIFKIPQPTNNERHPFSDAAHASGKLYFEASDCCH